MRLEHCPRRSLAVAALLLTALIGPLWYATPDAAAYLSTARRLAHGAAPHAFGQSQPSFPLGYPLLISPVFTIADRPFVFLSVINWLLAVGFMLGTYRWLRRIIPDAAVLLTLLVMAHVNVWNLYRRTLSEVLFLPLLMWIVVLTDSALSEQEGIRRGAYVVAITLLLVWLTATRETGLLAVLASIPVAFASRRAPADTTERVPPAATVTRFRNWRNGAQDGVLIAAGATAAAVGALLVLRPERRAAAVNAMRAAFGDGDDNIANGMRVILLGVRRQIVEIAQLTIPGMFKGYADPPVWWDVNLVVGVAVVMLVAVGWWRLAQRRIDVLVLMGPLYFVAVSVWPYESGARYLLPLLPLLVACAWEAWAPLGGLRRWLIALTVVAHCGVAAGYWWWIDRPRAQACHAAWPVAERTARLPDPRHQIGARGLPACVQLMVQLERDRPVPRPLEGSALSGPDG